MRVWSGARFVSGAFFGPSATRAILAPTSTGIIDAGKCPTAAQSARCKTQDPFELRASPRQPATLH